MNCSIKNGLAKPTFCSCQREELVGFGMIVLNILLKLILIYTGLYLAYKLVKLYVIFL